MFLDLIPECLPEDFTGHWLHWTWISWCHSHNRRLTAICFPSPLKLPIHFTALEQNLLAQFHLKMEGMEHLICWAQLILHLILWIYCTGAVGLREITYSEQSKTKMNIFIIPVNKMEEKYTHWMAFRSRFNIASSILDW